jgi:hypothetical protein
MAEATINVHADADEEDDPTPIDPAQLLLGLPALAAQRLVAHLAASGSSSLVTLLQVSSESRALVAVHAPSATYTLGAGSSRMGRVALQAMAGRAGGELELTLVASGGSNSGTELAQLFTEAIEGGQDAQAAGARLLSVRTVKHALLRACPHTAQLG